MATARKIGFWALVLALSVTFISAQPAEPQLREPDVRFVPTPAEVVDAMLELAKVRKTDIVYDLGCGDGRTVIRAAERLGARGVGIDIDPKRVEESWENARKSGVVDRVSFRNEDVLEADISGATVVTLYLSHSMNMNLRPKLWRELKPGTRVVSHAFAMEDWEPEQKTEIGWRTVYLWTIRGEEAALQGQSE